MSVSLGVDLGGTKIEVVAIETRADNFSILAKRRVPTERERGFEWIVGSVHDQVAAVCAELSLDPHAVPLGVGMPGGIRSDGAVKNSNTVCLNGRDFDGRLGELFQRPTRRGTTGASQWADRPPIILENDANCFAFAEARFGAGRAHATGGVVFGVILGTGVGGGVVWNGSIWRGPQGIAGEWGHHRVNPEGRPCYCGQRGCVERYLSGPAVEDEYLAQSGNALPLQEIAARRWSDPVAREVIEQWLVVFGHALANVINIIDPSIIVLGGGVSNLDLVYTEGIPQVALHVFNEELTTPIVQHQLGDSAGVLGAALLPLGGAMAQ